MSEVIKSYKGFNKDMTCRGFQYEEGKEYEESNALVCENGFHTCEYPLDCLGYYSPRKVYIMKLNRVESFRKNQTIPKLHQQKLKLVQNLVLQD